MAREVRHGVFFDAEARAAGDCEQGAAAAAGGSACCDGVGDGGVREEESECGGRWVLG